MPIYDFAFKLEGVKKLCGGSITDDEIGFRLFPVLEMGQQRSAMSRLRSGEHELSIEQKSILAEEFNARIALRLAGGNSNFSDSTLRADDWEKSLPEFFGHLKEALELSAPEALTRAHAAILDGLHGLLDYRERSHALLIENFDPRQVERYRFPASAIPIDPEELPPAHLTAGEQMIVALVDEANDEPAKGWLFFVRNPDTREPITQDRYIWDQKLEQMLYWQPGGPFELPARYTGPLPGYPTETTHLTGFVTAFLLVEPLDSPAIEELIRKPFPQWDGISAPPFESIAHLITCARRLFQRGNAKSYARGQLAYKPPKVFVRRYRIHPNQ